MGSKEVAYFSLPGISEYCFKGKVVQNQIVSKKLAKNLLEININIVFSKCLQIKKITLSDMLIEKWPV